MRYCSDVVNDTSHWTDSAICDLEILWKDSSQLVLVNWQTAPAEIGRYACEIAGYSQ